MITEIGKHRVQHANIMGGIDALMAGDMADFVYSDPPWGQGNLRYWQTMNKKMTGAERQEIDYSEFIEKLFSIIARYARDRVVIEYGVRWKDDIQAIAARYGFSGPVHRGIYDSKNLPLDFHFLSKSGQFTPTTNVIDKLKIQKGLKIVETIFDDCCPIDSKIVLDPMCGMGYTAQAAVNRGMAFRGNELNSKRLGKTIARLEKDKSR